MKRVLIYVILALVAFLSLGCNPKKENALNYMDDTKEEEIKYEVDQILLSKSFQSTEPYAEIITKSSEVKVLASLGLTESSGVNINKVIRKNNEIFIYVKSVYNETDLKLAVPQVILNLKKLNLRKIEDLKFNIVNEDYRPLKIKIGLNEVLNKLQSHFKISSVGSPIVNLTRLNDSILWNVSYSSIFDRDNSQIPLINLSASIDANSGDIIESKKTFISSSIDEGNILDYALDNFILYKKDKIDSDTNKTLEQLWYYDISNKEKEMIFSSNTKILSAQYSDDLSYISVIESDVDNKDLYIIPKEDKRAYKVYFEDKFNPTIMRWKDDNSIYLIENNKNRSIVYNYGLKNNEINKIGIIDKDIQDCLVSDDLFLIVENSEDEYNKKITTTVDWKEFKSIDNGLNPQFIDKANIAYLKKDEKVDITSLFIYNIKDNKIINEINENIANFQVISHNMITYVKKNNTHNNFTLSQYLLDTQKNTDITDLIADKFFLDPTRNTIYLNIVLPFENDQPELIYSINLSKLN